MDFESLKIVLTMFTLVVGVGTFLFLNGWYIVHAIQYCNEYFTYDLMQYDAFYEIWNDKYHLNIFGKITYCIFTGIVCFLGIVTMYSIKFINMGFRWKKGS